MASGWVKLNDDYYDHPKFAGAGPLAELLWLRAIAWTNRNLTDGRIPDAIAARLSGDLREIAVELNQGHEVSSRWLATCLVEHGLWDDDEDNGGYQIHDYLAHQRTADQIRDVSAKRADAGRRGAATTNGTSRPGAIPGSKSGASPVAEGATPPANRAAKAPPKGQQLAQQLAQQMAGKPSANMSAEVRSKNQEQKPPTTSVDLENPVVAREAGPDGDEGIIAGHSGYDNSHDPRIVAVIEMLVDQAEAAERAAGRPIGTLAPWRAGVRRNRTAEHSAVLGSLAAEHPDWTAERLAATVTDGDTPRAPSMSDQPKCPRCHGWHHGRCVLDMMTQP